MTIDEAIQRLITTRKQKGRFSVNECIAFEIAIASLEAWEKVKAEIEELEKSYGFDKATKYGNKDEKQMDLSYSTMYMYEIAGMVDEIKEIIDKHLQEIKNG